MPDLQLSCRCSGAGPSLLVEGGAMEIRELLHSAGLRRTRAREVVLALLRTTGKPLTHHEVAACPEAQGLDRVTVYRTLTALAGAGLVHRVQGVDGVWRFGMHDPVRPGCPGNHAHCLCLVCGTMRCLTDQPMPFVSVPEGWRVDGKQLLLYGRCPQCPELAGRAAGQASESLAVGAPTSQEPA